MSSPVAWYVSLPQTGISINQLRKKPKHTHKISRFWFLASITEFTRLFSIWALSVQAHFGGGWNTPSPSLLCLFNGLWAASQHVLHHSIFLFQFNPSTAVTLLQGDFFTSAQQNISSPLGSPKFTSHSNTWDQGFWSDCSGPPSPKMKILCFRGGKYFLEI